MLTGMVDALRSAGLPVVETPGWRGRGHGPMADVRGVTCHHTASGRGTGTTLGLSTVRDGRPDLPGPLAQLYLNRAGVFYVIAAGLCYHAGASQRPDQTNAHRIGIEALAAGDGWELDWPRVQMDAYARGCRALADHYGFPISEVRGHKETCSPAGRKTDPTFDMSAFRRTVGANLQATREDDDMNPSDKVKLTDADALAIGGKSKAGDETSWGAFLRFPPSVARLRREMNEGLATLHDENARLQSQVKASNDRLSAVSNDLAAVSNDLAAIRALLAK